MNMRTRVLVRTLLTALGITVISFTAQIISADATDDDFALETSSIPEQSMIDGKGISNESSIVAFGPEDCGKRFHHSTNFHVAEIRRSKVDQRGGGIGIRYQLHFQSRYPNSTKMVLMEPYYNNADRKDGGLTREPPQSKRNYYFHKSVWVVPGGIVGFDAIADFEPPIGGTMEGTSQFHFRCRAR